MNQYFKIIFVLILLASAGCGNITQGYVVKKEFRPSGTKLTVLPTIKTEEPLKVFWLKFKLRDKTAKYVLILVNEKGLVIPTQVTSDVCYESSIGKNFKLNGKNGNILYLELLKNCLLEHNIF